MKRRDFLKTGAAAAGVARFPAPGGRIADARCGAVRRRVGRVAGHADAAGAGRSDRAAGRNAAARPHPHRRQLRAAVGRGTALERRRLSARSPIPLKPTGGQSAGTRARPLIHFEGCRKRPRRGGFSRPSPSEGGPSRRAAAAGSSDRHKRARPRRSSLACRRDSAARPPRPRTRRTSGRPHRCR